MNRFRILNWTIFLSTISIVVTMPQEFKDLTRRMNLGEICEEDINCSLTQSVPLAVCNQSKICECMTEAYKTSNGNCYLTVGPSSTNPVNTDTLYLQWKNYGTGGNNVIYTVNYNCKGNKCTNHILTKTTNKTYMITDEIAGFNNCYISLFASSRQLDNISVNIPNPTTYNTVLKKLIDNLEHCIQLKNTTNIMIQLKCLSRNCLKKTTEKRHYVLSDRFRESLEIDYIGSYELQPLTLYEMKIVVYETNSKIGTNLIRIRTPPEKLHSGKNLNVSYKNNLYSTLPATVSSTTKITTTSEEPVTDLKIFSIDELNSTVTLLSPDSITEQTKKYYFDELGSSTSVASFPQQKEYPNVRPDVEKNEPRGEIAVIISIVVVSLLGLLCFLICIKRKYFLRVFNSYVRQNVRQPEEMSLIRLHAMNGSLKIKNLAKYITTFINDDNEIIKQFKFLPTKQANTSTTKKMYQQDFNDYIYANYIKDLNKRKAYIAAQGPKFSTVQAFWQMIWREQVETIVMASQFMENGKRKCAEYWNEHVGTIYECGLIEIKLESEKKFDQYTKRVFQICNEQNYCRHVEHFQINWSPDHLVPLYPDNLVPLVKRIHAISKNSQAPILVHCSQGISKTGVLILCALALHMAATENSINFYSLLKKIRKQRPNMVPSVNLYILAHFVVYECLIDQETISEKYKKELYYIKKLCAHDQFIYNNWLSRQLDPSKTADFNNLKICVLKHPDAQTSSKFWANVINKHIKVILFLNKFTFDQWPITLQISTNRIIVTKSEITEADSTNSDYTITKLCLKCIQLTTGEIYENDILLCEVVGWRSNKIIPPAFQGIINVINKISQYNDENHLLISCHDGITASGLFICFWLMMKTWRREDKLEVLNSIRLARRLNNKFLSKKKQQKFLLDFQDKYNKDPSVLNVPK